MKHRTYHDLTEADRSRMGEQVAGQRRRVEDRLSEVKRVVAVMSGKGGVGKSYITSILAHGLARRLTGGVGVIDADLSGPTAARLLNARGPLVVDEEGVHPAAGRDGIRVMSTDLLLPEGNPMRWRGSQQDGFVWRGALEAGTLREFLGDVVWGQLDLLLVDLPPGSNRLQDLIELVPGLTGALAVTIPTEDSRRSVERAMQAARDAEVPLLGVVENMSGATCEDCGVRAPLFPGDAGRALADQFGVALMGSIPFTRSTEPPEEIGVLVDALLRTLS
ncbi:MAG: P-loop NTPase [Gemmatimonadales bacterium]|nr:P-loop NTPase [Gemmatimonadales bacterium]